MTFQTRNKYVYTRLFKYRRGQKVINPVTRGINYGRAAVLSGTRGRRNDVISGRSLSETTIHSILQNERRRYVLKYLREQERQTCLRDVAEWIAVIEADESPPPTNVRNSVYVSLHQSHLPKLDEAGLIDYDRDRKTIALRGEAREVDIYTEVVTTYGITWAAYYLGLGVLSLLVVVAAAVNAPGLAWLGPGAWAIGGLLLLLGSGAYQYWIRFRPYLQWPPLSERL